MATAAKKAAASEHAEAAPSGDDTRATLVDHMNPEAALKAAEKEEAARQKAASAEE